MASRRPRGRSIEPSLAESSVGAVGSTFFMMPSMKRPTSDAPCSGRRAASAFPPTRSFTICFIVARSSANVGQPRELYKFYRKLGIENLQFIPLAEFSADGTHIAYRMNNSWDEERRNYRGGQNRPIWIIDRS